MGVLAIVLITLLFFYLLFILQFRRQGHSSFEGRLLYGSLFLGAWWSFCYAMLLTAEGNLTLILRGLAYPAEFLLPPLLLHCILVLLGRGFGQKLSGIGLIYALYLLSYPFLLFQDPFMAPFALRTLYVFFGASLLFGDGRGLFSNKASYTDVALLLFCSGFLFFLMFLSTNFFFFPVAFFPYHFAVLYAIRQPKEGVLVFSDAWECMLLHSNEGIVVFSCQGRVLEVSSSAERFLGRTKDRLLGKEYGSLGLGKDFQDAIFSVLQGRACFFLERVQGQETILEGKVMGIGQKSRLCLLIIRDRILEETLESEERERKRIEESLYSAREDLQLQEEMDGLYRMVEEELRTPLLSMVGFTQIMEDRFLRRILPDFKQGFAETTRSCSQFRSNLQTLREEARNLLELVEDVLTLSRMEADSPAWRRAALRMEDVLIEAVAKTQVMYKERNLPLILDFEEGLPYVFGNRERLVQLVENLLKNALDFTLEGGVFLRLRLVRNRIRVCVTDTGVGIREEELPSIFKKHYQGRNPHGQKKRGTGLGLPICKGIALQEGGELEVYSKVGQGSLFSLLLPTAQRVVEGITTLRMTLDGLLRVVEDSEAPGVPLILVVSKEERVRFRMKKELLDAGFAVVEACSPMEALFVMRQERPSLIAYSCEALSMGGFSLRDLMKKDLGALGLPLLEVCESYWEEGSFFATGIETTPFLDAVLKELSKDSILHVFLAHEDYEVAQKLTLAFAMAGFSVYSMDRNASYLPMLPQVVVADRARGERLRRSVSHREKVDTLFIFVES